MNRRDFIKSLAAIVAVASVPIVVGEQPQAFIPEDEIERLLARGLYPYELKEVTRQTFPCAQEFILKGRIWMPDHSDTRYFQFIVPDAVKAKSKKQWVMDICDNMRKAAYKSEHAEGYC